MAETAAPGLCALVIALVFSSLVACNRAGDTGSAPGTRVAADANPASGNLAPVDQPVQPAPPVATSQQSAQYYPPASPNYPATQSYPAETPPDPGYSSYDLPVDDQGYPPDEGYDTATYEAQVETTEPPPPLPEYSQPPCPGDGYYWTPGYWAYADRGYYWVPGAWVLVPWVDALWTPPYWDWEGRYYRWHGGYWGPHIGFYGGIDYGFGYTGRGYYGAYWKQGRLNYNRAVTNVNINIVHNVYNYSVPQNNNSRISYNGGRGGVSARPTPQEMAVVRDPRSAPVAAHVQHQRQAATNRAQFAAAGRGQPETLVARTPLQTSYRAPAPQPPAAALRAAGRNSSPLPAPGRPNEPQNTVAGQAAATRPEPNRPPVETRPMQEVRPGQRGIAPGQVPGPAPQPAAAPRPEMRQPETAPRPEVMPRPGQEVRPTPQPSVQPRPSPGIRQAPQPPAARTPVTPRPTPEVRQMPGPRPVPETRSVPQPAPAPRPGPPGPVRESRPGPRSASRTPGDGCSRSTARSPGSARPRAAASSGNSTSTTAAPCTGSPANTSTGSTARTSGPACTAAKEGREKR
jgi:hypothetical protein